MVRKTVRSETAQLKDNQQITVSFFAETDRGCSHGDQTIKPEDANYFLCKQRFNLEKPGDATTIDSEWQDGEWVELTVSGTST